MIIYDISQELFQSEIFPGDPKPQKELLLSLDKEQPDACQLTKMTFGSHVGTHLDAPKHFYKDGKDVSQIELTKCIGECKVVNLSGKVGAIEIEKNTEDGTERLLIRGNIELTEEAAQKITEKNLKCIGVEGFTVGSIENPRNVHLELLGKEVVIIEGLRMKGVKEGKYFLIAQPLKMEGLDGSPVRAILIKQD